jgi:hypothetical protein
MNPESLRGAGWKYTFALRCIATTGALPARIRYTAQDNFHRQDFMKKPSKNARIDVNAEIVAMADYIATRYDNLPDPAVLFQRIYAAVLADAPLWFDEHPMFEAVLARIQRRLTLLTGTGMAEDEARRYDAPAQLMVHLPMQLKRLHEAAREFTGAWDYSRRARAAYSAVVQDFPDLPKVLPKGWAQARRDYTEHDDMYAYAVNGQRKDEAAFQGIDSGGAGAGGFTMRTALTSVMYDDLEQNRKAPYAFFAAVYSHFLVVISHNNAVGMRAAFHGLDLGDTAAELRYDLPVDLATGNPLVDTVVEMARADCWSADQLRKMKADFDKAEQRRALQTPEQLVAEEAASKVHMQELIASLCSREPNPEVEQRFAAREVDCRTRLKAHFAAASRRHK